MFVPYPSIKVVKKLRNIQQLRKRLNAGLLMFMRDELVYYRMDMFSVHFYVLGGGGGGVDIKLLNTYKFD